MKTHTAGPAVDSAAPSAASTSCASPLRSGQERAAEQNEHAFLGSSPRARSSPRPSLSTPPDGQPLGPSVRRAFEVRLGHSFADVRVFADGDAARAARALNARAFTHGDEIFFGEREYSPATRCGRALLAHELTHVAQQRRRGRPEVMLRGGTFTGFFANIFRFWDYSREALEEYLEELRRTDDIVDDYDSDDMARQVAEEWHEDQAAFELTPRLRVLLIREMLSGFVTGADQEGVMRLLQGSRNTELRAMIGSGAGQIGYAQIHERFGGWRARLELFGERVLRRLGTYQEAPAGGTSLRESLEETEQVYGLRVEQASLSFRLDAGALLRSFLVDVVVPAAGSTVTVTITREQLRISISPGIVIDIIGPVNDTLTSVRFGFEGMTPQVGLSRFSERASAAAADLIRELLEGTRFAAPGYDFTRDPTLLAEIRDGSIIGDIERVRYNLERNADREEPAEDEEAVDERLGVISQVGASLTVTHPRERRIPESAEGYGLLIPAGTQFTLRLEVAGSGSELYQRDAVLERLGISSSGLYVMHGDVRLVQVEGFDLLPGFDIELRGFRELTDLTPYVREELPESIADAVAGTLETLDQARAAYDMLVSLFSGERQRSPSVTASVVEALAELVLGMEAASLARSFREPLRTYTGMRPEQIDRFFGR